MHGYGTVGRAFAGRVVERPTASTGLADWEWGVTLLADDPKAIKDVVYEMRYDEGSAYLRGVRAVHARARAGSRRRGRGSAVAPDEVGAA